MPKRRMTAKRKAQIARWQKASYSAPRLSPSGIPKSSAYTKAGRSHKIRGKAAIHHTATVTIAPWVQQVLAGKPVTHSTKTFHPDVIRGDITQAKGVPYRRKPKSKGK